MSSGFRKFLLACLAVVILIGFSLAWIARSPDHEIVFDRLTQSSLSPETLSASIHFVPNWPHWHHMTTDAVRVDEQGKPLAQAEQIVAPGALIRLGVEPKGYSWRRFELTFRVLRYEQGRLLQVELAHDSKGKIAALFRHLEWTITLELGNRPGTSRLELHARAMTGNARARILAAIAPRILMNQVVYADLLTLAKFDQPQRDTKPGEKRKIQPPSESGM